MSRKYREEEEKRWADVIGHKNKTKQKQPMEALEFYPLSNSRRILL